MKKHTLFTLFILMAIIAAMTSGCASNIGGTRTGHVVIQNGNPSGFSGTETEKRLNWVADEIEKLQHESPTLNTDAISQLRKYRETLLKGMNNATTDKTTDGYRIEMDGMSVKELKKIPDIYKRMEEATAEKKSTPQKTAKLQTPEEVKHVTVKIRNISEDLEIEMITLSEGSMLAPENTLNKELVFKIGENVFVKYKYKDKKTGATGTSRNYIKINETTKFINVGTIM